VGELLYFKAEALVVLKRRLTAAKNFIERLEIRREPDATNVDIVVLSFHLKKDHKFSPTLLNGCHVLLRTRNGKMDKHVDGTIHLLQKQEGVCRYRFIRDPASYAHLMAFQGSESSNIHSVTVQTDPPVPFTLDNTLFSRKVSLGI